MNPSGIYRIIIVVNINKYLSLLRNRPILGLVTDPIALYVRHVMGYRYSGKESEKI
jgi:hypothetical protein